MIPGLEYESLPDGGDDRNYAYHEQQQHHHQQQQQQQYSNNNHSVELTSSQQYHPPPPSSSSNILHRRRIIPTNVNNNNKNNNNNNDSTHYVRNASHSTTSTAFPKGSATVAALRKLDILFPKASEREYIVQTERGGQFTALGYIVIFVLLLAEVRTWKIMNSMSLEHIVVDTSLGKRMRVNLNITFPSLHCDDVHLDVIDTAGDSHLNLSDQMYKQRLIYSSTSGQFQPIGIQKIVAEANIKAEQDRQRRAALEKEIPPDYCGSCYGADDNNNNNNEEEEGEQKDGVVCCNTCDSVLEAYKRKHWNDAGVLLMSEQCIREGRSNMTPKKLSTGSGEGCNLSGHFTVNRVAGNFHIAMGEGVDRDGRHIHHFLPEDRVNFNASHIVHELSFLDEEYALYTTTTIRGNGGGDGGVEEDTKKKHILGGISGEQTMNGIRKTTTEELGTTGLFQYFIKIVPTRYKGEIIDQMMTIDVPPSPLSGNKKKKKKNTNDDDIVRIVETNRYFYTERFRPLIGEVHEEAYQHGDPDRGMAGMHVGGKTGGSSLQTKMEHHDTQNAVLPGIFFIYEIYPFAVEITRNKVPFVHLLMRILATMGGVLTFMSLIDGIVYSREKKGRGWK